MAIYDVYVTDFPDLFSFRCYRICRMPVQTCMQARSPSTIPCRCDVVYIYRDAIMESISPLFLPGGCRHPVYSVDACSRIWHGMFISSSSVRTTSPLSYLYKTDVQPRTQYGCNLLEYGLSRGAYFHRITYRRNTIQIWYNDVHPVLSVSNPSP